MNWRSVRALAAKDLREVRRNRTVWLPMVIVPLILNVLLPIFMIALPLWMGEAELEDPELTQMLAMIPQTLDPEIATMSAAAQWVVFASSYMFAPMFLIVPLMLSSIIGADSFVGERERKTIEALLYTPMTDDEIFMGKLLAAFVPATLISVFSFVVYTIVVNVAGYSTVGHIFFPRRNWWSLVFWLGPAVSVLGLGATVLVSSKAKSFMQAQQLAGVMVLPVVFLMIAQISGLFFLGIGLTMAIGLGVWIIGLWLVWIGSKTFSRDAILSQI